MRAGGMRNKIEIQIVTETSDGMGGFTETWSEYTTAWAEIRPMRGEESLEWKKLEHEYMHRIWIRYQSGITAKMRIIWGDRIMKIVGLRNPDERNRSLEILAEELVT
jgi:SPP1 family predicted phage head-tail adaptor